MVQAGTTTGMVSPPKEASKYIMKVHDENSGALMVALPINQDDLDFLNVLIEHDVFTRENCEKAMIESIVKTQKIKRETRIRMKKEKGLTSEEATRREFSRRL